METIIYVIMAVLVGLGIFLIVSSVLHLKEAVETQRDIAFLQNELQRAKDKIYSDNIEENFDGLQKLRVLNDPALRIAVLPRVTELTAHDDDQLAEFAQETVESISDSVANQFGGNLQKVKVANLK